MSTAILYMKKMEIHDGLSIYEKIQIQGGRSIYERNANTLYMKEIQILRYAADSYHL